MVEKYLWVTLKDNRVMYKLIRDQFHQNTEPPPPSRYLFEHVSMCGCNLPKAEGGRESQDNNPDG